MALGACCNFHTLHMRCLILDVKLGTCAMKRETDQGVVDARLNVYGVTNLKVADMSIAPLNVGTVNTERSLLAYCLNISLRTRVRQRSSLERRLQ